jgi:hypothetical protein
MAKFQKGNPGGPGRPAGSRNTVNRLLDGPVNDDAETIVRRMIEAASEGDRMAARPVQLALPPIAARRLALDVVRLNIFRLLKALPPVTTAAY